MDDIMTEVSGRFYLVSQPNAVDVRHPRQKWTRNPLTRQVTKKVKALFEIVPCVQQALFSLLGRNACGPKRFAKLGLQQDLNCCYQRSDCFTIPAARVQAL